MDDFAKTSENGKPKSPPAAAQPAGGYERDAQIVTEMSAAGALSIVIGKTLQNAVRPPGYKVYRDEFLKASGASQDALEVLMLEQIAVAHHRILGLHSQAAGVETPEMIEVLTSAAAKLTAEMRRLCLAVREYRAPVGPRSVTLVKTQNVAGGDQRIALLDKRPSVPTQNIETTAISDNQNKALTHEVTSTFDSPIFELASAPIESVQRLG
jgi:hypothetical protein